MRPDPPQLQMPFPAAWPGNHPGNGLSKEVAIDVQTTRRVLGAPASPVSPWWEWAACRDAGPSPFYDQHPYRVIRRFCDPCPVVDVCLFAALVEEECETWRYGVRGGMGPNERAAWAEDLRRRGFRLRELLALELAWLDRLRPQLPRRPAA